MLELTGLTRICCGGIEAIEFMESLADIITKNSVSETSINTSLFQLCVVVDMFAFSVCRLANLAIEHPPCRLLTLPIVKTRSFMGLSDKVHF